MNVRLSVPVHLAGFSLLYVVFWPSGAISVVRSEEQVHSLPEVHLQIFRVIHPYCCIEALHPADIPTLTGEQRDKHLQRERDMRVCSWSCCGEVVIVADVIVKPLALTHSWRHHCLSNFLWCLEENWTLLISSSQVFVVFIQKLQEFPFPPLKMLFVI